MLPFILKYFVLFFFALMISIYLVNDKITIKLMLYNLLFSIFTMPFLHILKMHLPIIRIPILILFLFLFNILINDDLINYKVFRSAFSLALLSLSFSFLVNLIINTTTVVVFKILTPHISDNLILVFSLIIQVLILHLCFKIKRFKNTFKYVSERYILHILLLICFFILSCYGFISTITNIKILILQSMLYIIILGIILLLIYRISIRLAYINIKKELDLENAYNIIIEKESYIKELEENNYELAKIVHRDNKIIPAMKNAVTDFIYENSSGIDKSAEIIISQLKNIAQDRKGLLQYYKKSNTELPSSHVPSLDILLNYMLMKANSLNINFEILYLANVSNLINLLLSEEQFNTLVGDLIDNSLNALKSTKNGKILFNIEIINDFYRINIFDNGMPFPINILLDLGLHNITSHSEDGGSGIGIMNIFDTMETLKFSFIISEYETETNIYTKCVSIYFNNKKKYYINSYRSELLHKMNERKDIIFNSLENDIIKVHHF